MKFLKQYIKQHRLCIIAFVLFCGIFTASFELYRLPLGAALYPSAICLILSVVFAAYDLHKAYIKHKRFKSIQIISGEMSDLLPKALNQDDIDYREIIERLINEQKETVSRISASYSDMVDYYTVWAHQIKTPIASMKLRLQNEDSDMCRKLNSDLFRIEQYADMVLMFLRLDSDSTDYVIREYDLDGIVKQAVKKFADDFIYRKLRLEYTPLNMSVVTDEKWLSFVIEQVISNALKYTPSGRISIWCEKPQTLCIGDTGIGIAPEDVPRIFEKGYTGYNGRSDKKASGIGLYLCKRICNALGHDIHASSSLGKGTVIYIELDRIDIEYE